MKKLLIALAAVLVTAASYAQGTINFNTRFSTANVNAPVELGAGGPGPGPTYTAALYLVNGANLTLIPSSVTTFRDGSSNPLLAKYINSVVATVDGVPQGQSATVRMRAWLTSAGSFDAAATTARGESPNLTIASLGGGAVPPGDLPSSFTGFIIPVPEPSTIALGVLGAAALLLRRRK